MEIISKHVIRIGRQEILEYITDHTGLELYPQDILAEKCIMDDDYGIIEAIEIEVLIEENEK